MTAARPPVVLLPGLASDATLWRHQLPALQAAGVSVQVSDVHARHPTLDEMAGTLLEACDEPAVLVGTSMGGIVALHAWRRAPQRVAALALLGSSARADTPQMLALRSEAIELFAQGRMDEVLRANLPFVFHASRARDEALAADYLAMIHRAGAGQLIAQNRAIMARDDLRGALPSMRCPLLVVCGADDALTPPECSHEIAAAVPGAELHELPQCGHLLTWERPAAVNALLLGWLRRIGAAAA